MSQLIYDVCSMDIYIATASVIKCEEEIVHYKHAIVNRDSDNVSPNKIRYPITILVGSCYVFGCKCPIVSLRIDNVNDLT